MVAVRNWPFLEPRGYGVFTTGRVLARVEPILHVVRERGDGGWRFLGVIRQPPDIFDIVGVTLEDVMEVDSSIQELADLPYGSMATREAAGMPWILTLPDAKARKRGKR